MPARMSAIEGTSGPFASGPDPTLVTQTCHRRTMNVSCLIAFEISHPDHLAPLFGFVNE